MIYNKKMSAALFLLTLFAVSTSWGLQLRAGGNNAPVVRFGIFDYEQFLNSLAARLGVDDPKFLKKTVLVSIANHCAYRGGVPAPTRDEKRSTVALLRWYRNNLERIQVFLADEDVERLLAANDCFRDAEHAYLGL
jgi:hypothetical protein